MGEALGKPRTAVAFKPDVVRRGVVYAIVVGAILMAINHGDAIVNGEDGMRWIRSPVRVFAR